MCRPCSLVNTRRHCLRIRNISKRVYSIILHQNCPLACWIMSIVILTLTRQVTWLLLAVGIDETWECLISFRPKFRNDIGFAYKCKSIHMISLYIYIYKIPNAQLCSYLWNMSKQETYNIRLLPFPFLTVYYSLLIFVVKANENWINTWFA